jgi:hypothetical protein
LVLTKYTFGLETWSRFCVKMRLIAKHIKTISLRPSELRSGQLLRIVFNELHPYENEIESFI